jgi:hypothetical protein
MEKIFGKGITPPMLMEVSVKICIQQKISDAQKNKV